MEDERTRMTRANTRLAPAGPRVTRLFNQIDPAGVVAIAIANRRLVIANSTLRANPFTDTDTRTDFRHQHDVAIGS